MDEFGNAQAAMKMDGFLDVYRQDPLYLKYTSQNMCLITKQGKFPFGIIVLFIK